MEVEALVVLENVDKTTKIAEAAKLEVTESKNVQEVLVKIIEKEAAITEEKLLDAAPSIKQAEDALKMLKPADIATVRKLGKPPFLITVIMDVILLLFRKKFSSIKPNPEKQFLQTSWEDSLKVMNDTRFLPKIVDFNRDLINAETVDLMVPYLEYPQYTTEAASVACGNVSGLLDWTRAMAEFYEVNKNVLPLKASLAISTAKLVKANKALKILEDSLAEKERELDTVQKEYDAANQALQKVKDEAKINQDKMEAAVALIGGLADNRMRWTEQLAQIKDETGRLVGDVLILAGFLSYTGPFNQEFRSRLRDNWNEQLSDKLIPQSASISYTERLSDSATIGEWNLQGKIYNIF